MQPLSTAWNQADLKAVQGGGRVWGKEGKFDNQVCRKIRGSCNFTDDERIGLIFPFCDSNLFVVLFPAVNSLSQRCRAHMCGMPAQFFSK